MQIVRIGLDLVKYVSIFTVLTSAAKWFCVRLYAARALRPSSQTFRPALLVWKLRTARTIGPRLSPSSGMTFEPPRVCRRPFRLSHAANARSSISV